MTVSTYSLKIDGNKIVGGYFRLKEFACKDGSDLIKVDLALIDNLCKIREHFRKPVIINSAYRTAAHNKRVGGSSKSQHLLGKAADIRIEGVAPLLVAQYAEYLGMGGIGLYSTFTHVDTRAGKVRWDQRSGTAKAVSSFGGTINTQKGDDDEMERWKTVKDIPAGYYRQEAERLINAGILKGDGNGVINLTEDMLRTILICERLK